MYDEGRELDKVEMLRLKMNRKLGFTGKERRRCDAETRLKSDKKLGLPVKTHRQK